MPDQSQNETRTTPKQRREANIAALVEEINPSDPDIGSDRFAAVQAWPKDGEKYIATCPTLRDALDYHGDGILEGWEPVMVVDLDTGHRFDRLEVSTPIVTLQLENEIPSHVYTVQRETIDGLYLFVDGDQAAEYAARHGLQTSEEVLLNRSAAAQFLIDTYDEEDDNPDDSE